MRTASPEPAVRLTIFVLETDQYRHRPLYSEIVHRARKKGLAGASVFRGLEGFGASALIHTSRLLSLSVDLPVAIVVVDAEAKIHEFIPELEELITVGLAVLDPVQIYRYTTHEHSADEQKRRGRWRSLIAGKADHPCTEPF